MPAIDPDQLARDADRIEHLTTRRRELQEQISIAEDAANEEIGTRPIPDELRGSLVRSTVRRRHPDMLDEYVRVAAEIDTINMRAGVALAWSRAVEVSWLADARAQIEKED